jgi:hypothetical protein
VGHSQYLEVFCYAIVIVGALFVIIGKFIWDAKKTELFDIIQKDYDSMIKDIYEREKSLSEARATLAHEKRKFSQRRYVVRYNQDEGEKIFQGLVVVSSDDEYISCPGYNMKLANKLKDELPAKKVKIVSVTPISDVQSIDINGLFTKISEPDQEDDDVEEPAQATKLFQFAGAQA